MSIARMSYVRCDVCGDPGPMGDDGREARRMARSPSYGYVRRGRRDLCKRCKVLTPADQVARHLEVFRTVPDWRETP